MYALYLYDGPTWAFPILSAILHVGFTDYFDKDIRHGLPSEHVHLNERIFIHFHY